MTARSANAPSIVIDVEAAADDNGKYRSYGGSTAACASAVRSCFNTHGARFGSTGIALVRWVVEYQFFAARRLFRSCMSNLDRAELSARLASAEQRRLELQEALAQEQAGGERLKLELTQLTQAYDQLEAQARAATAQAEADARRMHARTLAQAKRSATPPPDRVSSIHPPCAASPGQG